MTKWFNWWHFFGPGLKTEASWPVPVLDEKANEDGARLLSPLAAPVHVHSGSALVRIDNGVLLIERESEPRFERPLELVSAVHIYVPASITGPCVAQLVDQGSPVVWRSASGYPLGCALPMHQAGLEVRRAQYAAAGTAQGLAVARALVAGKIVNLRGLVRRRAEPAGRACLDVLQHQARLARRAPNIHTLLGLEGAATAQYFAAWPTMLSSRVGELTFEKRTRRPPEDEINAMLSYAYAVLAGECLCACTGAGLDARQGLLHSPRAGRPALALDLMEPFRPVVADQAILAGANNGQFKPSHFRTGGKATLLTGDGRRLVLELIERRLSSEVKIGGRTEPMSWRTAIGVSARSLANALKSATTFVAMEWP